MDGHEEQVPGIGALAKDTDKNEVGVVMGKVGGRCQLRPLNGGREWDAHPDDLEQPTLAEELAAKTAARNRLTANGELVRSIL